MSEFIVGAPWASGAFYLLVGVGVFALLVMGKLMASMIGGNSRGFLPILLAQLVIVALGLGAAVLVQTLLAPHTQSVPLLHGSVIAGAAIGGFVGVVLVSRFLMGVTRGVGLVVTVLTLALGFGAIWGGRQLLGSIDRGEQVIENVHQQMEE
ncbi:hypothetical protein [Ruficoccus sp. ZRK36]|uniref:hypothetical protein n=1 Tax=Ruficoccus sp. ZRK36 TaxID=2866311 RepID=UPI001C737296|nr:hypothetical protein [Ruficoccus sp. ZRK36]QYY35331.1 hypothetical protein K0V07_13650 [Ruficoccus sp. ZRK36]